MTEEEKKMQARKTDGEASGTVVGAAEGAVAPAAGEGAGRLRGHAGAGGTGGDILYGTISQKSARTLNNVPCLEQIKAKDDLCLLF